MPISTQRRRSAVARTAMGLSAGTALFLLAAAPGADEDSPHHEQAACSACHEQAAPGAVADEMTFAHGTADETCLHCHEADPYDIGMPFKQAEGEGDVCAVLPAGWPLQGGNLACLTCHDEPTCAGTPADAQNPHFLRGAPYPTIDDFCAACHTPDQIAAYNPHEAMVRRAGSSSVCEFCHQNAVAGEESADDLKLAAPALCAGCHTEQDVHVGALEHLVALDAALVPQVEAAGLPLDQGKVYCGTCHDPHPAASVEEHADRQSRLGSPIIAEHWAQTVLAPAMAERAEGHGTTAAPRNEEPDYLRLALQNFELCQACHIPADIDAGVLGGER